MADVELLPLPWTLCHFHDDTQEAIRAYARANVLHHTAPLQAEIEALRAEVELWRHKAAVHQYRRKGLAEALRNFSGVLERLAFAIPAPNTHTPQLVELAIAMRAAALAQEDRNG